MARSHRVAYFGPRRSYGSKPRAAGVALGAVGPVVRDLETGGFLVQRENRTLTNTRKLLEEWVTRFPDTLRPKLLRRRYQAGHGSSALDLRVHHGYWGGEVAGQRLTGYLKPERFTLYLEYSAMFLNSRDSFRNSLKLSYFPEVSGFPCCL